MKKLTDTASAWIENLFGLFYGGRSLFCENGYKKNERREAALVDLVRNASIICWLEISL